MMGDAEQQSVTELKLLDAPEKLKTLEPAVVEPNAIQSLPTVHPTVNVTTSKQIAIDELSKWVAVALVFVYISGFLITSLHDFQYGFTQMNPLRPRILAAGGWFGMFLAVPFAIVMEWRRHGVWKRNVSKWHKAALLLYTYYFIANAITLSAAFIFDFDKTSPTGFSVSSWVTTGVFIAAGTIIGLGNVDAFSSRIPRWLIIICIFGVYGWATVAPFRDLFIRKLFLGNAPSLWVVLVGVTLLFEMKKREWKIVLGDWPLTMIFLLSLMTLFGTTYYPHIQSQWGGGAPVNVAITLSKDSPTHAGQTVYCSLIDETDSGFYVVGKGEKHATFIPRNEISLVHFADGNEQSLFSIPSK